MARWDHDWHVRLRKILMDLPFRSQPERVAIRQELAKDPVAFAIIYLSHHIRDADTGRITFSEVHYEWCSLAETEWRKPLAPQENRDAFIAPRETGKSTWWFLILPMWAAANGLSKFAVAFANADSQATGHLATFKRELDSNPLLQADFPDLCQPARKPSSGSTVADRQGMLHTKHGFVFAAKGVDSATLGLKVGEQRPDLLVFDDIEPHEAKYSPAQAVKRLATITDALFPLNIRARVVMVGTVTMPNSIMHQLVKSANGTLEEDEGKWIRDERVRAHHHLPLVENPDGSMRSVWPEKWPTDWLLSFSHTRSYAKNYANDPMGMDGAFWTSDDFIYIPVTDPPPTRYILTLDPAVTTKDTSDYTGWAVVAFRPGVRSDPARHIMGYPPMVEVVEAGHVKMMGEALRAFVLKKLLEYPQIKAVRVEVNQGGDLWYTALHDLPVKLLVHTSTEGKEVRFAYAVEYYNRGLVRHRTRLRALEEEMVSFPLGPYDDIADAVVAAILFFLGARPPLRTATTVEGYV